MSLDTVSGCTNMMVSKAPFSTCQEDDRTHLCSEAPGQSPVKGPSLLHESPIGPRTQCSKLAFKVFNESSHDSGYLSKSPYESLCLSQHVWRSFPYTDALIHLFLSALYCFPIPMSTFKRPQMAFKSRSLLTINICASCRSLPDTGSMKIFTLQSWVLKVSRSHWFSVEIQVIHGRTCHL